MLRRAAPLLVILPLAGCFGPSLPRVPAAVEPPAIEIEPVFVFEDDETSPMDEILERYGTVSPSDGGTVALPGFPPGVNPADFDITIHYNDDVARWIEYFTTRARDRFETYLARKGRYEQMILERLRARGMPEDLIFLAMIESGFSPRAVSSASAVGLWQFMAPTGRQYGLEVSTFVDERRDPIKATEAALDYLQMLYKRFGSWYLAAAGYNSGENRVDRILQERVRGVRGNDAIFWEIQPYLPAETRDYVPLMIAAAILSRYPELYGFNVEPEPPEQFDVVIVPDATDLDVIAEAAGTTREEIDALNPHFIRGVTPRRQAVEVRVPAGRGPAFEAAYALIPPENRVRFVEHVVRSGDTLSRIAATYGSTVAEIQDANGIRNPNVLRVGQVLVIPRAGAAAPILASAQGTTTTAASSASAATTTVHRVASGESLWTIAQRYGVSIDDLRAWNGIGASGVIYPGQQLTLRGGAAATASTAVATTVHRVASGESLWTIARRYGVSVDELRAWNGLGASAIIHPGQQLTVRGGTALAGAVATTVHRVASGESLWTIAQRYGVTVANLRAWNGLGTNSVIHPGQELTIRGSGTTAPVLTHRVRAGDTLWDIARLHGVTTAELMSWNGLGPSAIIRPGDELVIRIAD